MNTGQHGTQNTPLLATCCVCSRIRQSGNWRRDDTEGSVPRTHTYCPECLAIVVSRYFPGSENKAVA